MSLTREVMYLDSEHVNKLGEVKRKLGFNNHSEANRFIIDQVDTDFIEDSAELVVWIKVLRDSINEADEAVDKAEQSVDETLRYLRELKTQRLNTNESSRYS